jgi:hypothetical protein
MRKLLAAALLAGLVSATAAQEAKQEPKKIAQPAPQKKAEVALKVGDPARR